MSQLNAYTPITLLPSQQTKASSSPFVAPPFEMAFRKCEKLFWQANALENEVKELQMEDWGSDFKVEVGINFFERRLTLRLMFVEMESAKKQLERELEGMGRHLDPRYTRCSDADCMEGWLLDGAKINVLKARTLLQQFESLMVAIGGLFDGTTAMACEARSLLTRESEKASSGRTMLKMNLGLPDRES